MPENIDKLKEYIELLNNGLKPKNYDPLSKFSNGTPVNQYWAKNREKIITELKNNPLYQIGYEKAHEIIKKYIAGLSQNKIEEYINMLNSGQIKPKDNDTQNHFSNGNKIGNFWSNNKNKIISELFENPKYKTGYDNAKKVILDYQKSLTRDRISEYIELLNKGLIPCSIDQTHTFEDGTYVNKFWPNNKEKILERLKSDPKYNIGYESAHQIIKDYLYSLSFDKIADYIELLNKGLIKPRAKDNEHKFSNGEVIGYFWSNKREEILSTLDNNPKYKIGYGLAHQTIEQYLKSQPSNKLDEYINMLNNDKIIIQNYDPDHFFSNGDPINYFWRTNKNKIISELKNNPKYTKDYTIAKTKIKEFFNHHDIDRIGEYIELLNNGIITPSTSEKEVKFSDGRVINRFWSHKKEQIISSLFSSSRYATGYDKAKEIVKKYVDSFKIDKISEYIELLNKGKISIKYFDSTHFFSNGEAINYFWSNNKDNIVERINTDPKYQKGYNKARVSIYTKFIRTDKISEYIELLNKGYVPKLFEEEKKFSNGDIIGNFWSKKEHQFQIVYELNHNPNYQTNYEIAKKIINDITNLISSLGGDEQRAEKIYIANKRLKEKREKSNESTPTIPYFLQEFDIDLNTLNKFLAKTSKSSCSYKKRIEYHGETLKNYCIKNGYNYSVIFRLLKIHRHLPSKNFEELVPLVIDTYRHNIQNQPTLWVYEKYGVLLKHLLLLINVDSTGIIYNMKKYCISLEEAIRHEIFKRNIPNKKYKWLEELFNYIIEELDADKSEEELTNKIAKKFYDLNKEYNLTNEEVSILFSLLEKYILAIRKYLACSFVLEKDLNTKIYKARNYNLSPQEIEEAYFISLRIKGKIVIPEDHPLIQHFYILKKYYLIWDELTKEQQEYLQKFERITQEDIMLMRQLKENIQEILNILNSNKTFCPQN